MAKSKNNTSDGAIAQFRLAREQRDRLFSEISAITMRALALEQIFAAHVERFPHLAGPVIQVSKDIGRSADNLSKLLRPEMFTNAGLSADLDTE